MSIESKRCTARGNLVRDTKTGAPTEEKLADGQLADHFVLCPEDRAKGYVEPYRQTYFHVGPPGPEFELVDLTAGQRERFAGAGYAKFEPYPESRAPALGRYWSQAEIEKAGKGCGYSTTMPRACAETYAVQPGYYGSTYCAGCGAYFPVGADGEFVWDLESMQRVGTRAQPPEEVANMDHDEASEPETGMLADSSIPFETATAEIGIAGSSELANTGALEIEAIAADRLEIDDEQRESAKSAGRPLCADCRWLWQSIKPRNLYLSGEIVRRGRSGPFPKCTRPLSDRRSLIDGRLIDLANSSPAGDRRPGRAWFGLGRERCGPEAKFFERRERPAPPPGVSGIRK